jgi:hypothetical protein
VADEVVRRAEEHLQLTGTQERRLPELTRVTPADEGNQEIGCDLCDYVAVDPEGSSRYKDGWKTPDSHEREGIPSYLLCGPCQEAWQAGDYDDLYERCHDVRRVDDLAQLAGDTIRIPDAMRYRWERDRGDDGFGHEM